MKRKIFSIVFALALTLGFILAIAVPAGAVGPPTLYEHWNPAWTGGSYGSDDFPYMAQTFTAVGNHAVDKVKLGLFRTGSPGGITVSLRATDGSGHPTGPDLTSGSIDGDGVNTSPGAWYEITLDTPYDLTDGTNYAIVVADADANSGNHISWYLDMVGGYSGGNIEHSANGTSWAAILAYDFLFEVWGPGPPLTEVWVDDDYHDGGPNDGHTWGYDAFDVIQNGINAVESPGTVHVLAGYYWENITLRNGVDVLGAGDNVTTIDGSNSGTVVTALNVGVGTTLDGFTITHGNSGDYGGGMYNDGSSPAVTNCTFSDNVANDAGGGMYNKNSSSPTVTGCTFSGNWVNFGDGGGMYNDNSSPTVNDCAFVGNTAMYYGGGMCNDNSSSPTVTNCTFSGNQTGWDGGGMYNKDSSSPTVTNCAFSTNSADYGGGMYNDGSSPAVTNCTFFDNTAEDGGGMCNESSSPTVSNCTFSGNSATWGGGMSNIDLSSPTVTNCTFSQNTATNNGGGMCNQGSSPTITNNIIASNDAVNGGGIYADGSPLTISYNDVWDNVLDDYFGCGPGTGDISADPLFVNPGTGDFHLTPGSPCIDAGDNDAAIDAGLTTDFEGDDRTLDGDNNGSVVVDMGVDEHVPPPPTEVWVDDDWEDQDDVDVFNPSLTWQYDAFNSIQDGVDAVATDCTVHVLAGEYFEAVTIDKSLTLESDSGDWHDAYIDPPAGAVISLDADFGGDVTIDGLELYDGNYGIYINGLGSGGDIYILNCLIDDNNAGIYAEGNLYGSITIDDNCVIAGNSDDGIYLGNVEGVVRISDSYIGGYWDAVEEESYSGNIGDGIEINEIPLCSEGGAVYINHNVIAENGGNGIYVTGETVNDYLDIYNYNTIGAYDYAPDDDDVGYFTGNSECGILIETVGETGVVNIEDNRLAENGYEGICFYNDTNPLGIEVYGAVTINNNLIGAWTQWGADESQRYGGNGMDGIYVDQVYTDGSLDITNNRLAENYYDGIYIWETEGTVSITSNFAGSWTEESPDPPDIIYDGNDGTGIYVESVPGGSLLIRGNDVSGNLLEDNEGGECSGAITVIDNFFGGGAVTIGGSGAGEANNVSDNGTPEEDSGFDVGIYLSAVDQATIEGNTVTDHIDPTGFYELGGICLEGSSYNFIIGNTITNNGGGICLGDSSYNEISGNTVTDNGEGIYIDDDSDENSVGSNIIQDNDWDGIYIGGDNNDILDNDISGNGDDGIYIEGSNSEILRNDISGNGDDGEYGGIYLGGEDNVIHYNNITNNTTTGVYNENDSTDVDATLNWWGNASGPYHAVDNPTGLGDEVSDDVIFSPWLGYAAETSPMTFIADDSGPEPADGYIKTAVNAADDGDTVLVHPGTYLENNITINKSLTVQSVSGDWHDTIINATGGNGFQFISFDSTATISGFTINHGTYGIYVEGTDADSSITVSNCHIYEAGFAGIFGGDGLYGDIFIDDCVIGGNGLGVGGIGGIHLDNTVAGTVEITDSVIGAYYDATEDEYYDGNAGNGIQLDSIYATGNVLIDNCKIVENGGYGIADAIAGCSGELTITNNIIGAYDFDPIEPDACFDGNGNWGIHIDYVSGSGVVTIENNKLAENSGGIRIEQNYGDTTISNNYVGAWSEGTVTHDGNDGTGIYVESIPGGSLLIEDNNFSKNTSHGIDVHNNGDGTGDVTISGNTIDENGSGGYGLSLGEIDYATISGNTITNQSDALWSGVFLGSSDYNTISDNTINDNYIGIRIDSESSNNSVVNNVIQNNTVDGIVLYGDDNEILGNTISGNLGDGCGIRLTNDADDNVINFNNITGNSLFLAHGVYNEDITELVDARWNWWGDKSGPYYDPDNLDGLGDAVSDNVDYDPWLNAPVTAFVYQAGGEVDATDEADTLVYIWGGTADVYIAQYGSNPGGAFSGDTGKYIDVMVQNVDIGVTEIEIRLYYTNAEIPAGVTESSLRLRWWNGTSWVVCSDSGVDTTDVNGYSGYMWAKIRNDTTPNLAELTGTPFGGSGSIPGGGGGGVGTVGTVLPHAPRISNVLHEVTHTTANIYWITDEVSTSQVEYWASPSTLSPLNTAYVLTHHVRLVGLTPNTTYHYKVMSEDSSGNLTVSDEYTFTTLETPTAAFTASNLSISPAEVNSGGLVTITLSVANTGDAGGSYNVVLKINGVKEAEQSITLAAGKSQEVIFSVTKAKAGSYSVEVNGLTGSFTVAAAAAPIAWWIWVIAGAVVVGLIIFFLARRRA